MSALPESNQWRPERPLRLPLQTGDGFSTSLFMLGFAFAPAVVLVLVGVLLLFLRHWLLGPLLSFTGAFLIGAFWSFPRQAWVARPCDVRLDAAGFEIIGGYRARLRLAWDELDAKASRLRDGSTVLSRELVAATRDRRLIVVAEGEEESSFRALLDVWRAAQGLEPLNEAKKNAPTEAASGVEPVTVDLVVCNGCGAAARPENATHVRCLYCDRAVPMPDDLRQRLRELALGQALKARSQRLLQKLLEQPTARYTTAPLAVLAVLMLGSWLFGAGSFTFALLRGTLTFGLTLAALAAPLLLAILLGLVSSVIVSRRVAVRAVSLDFAAVAPRAPGKPCGCRVCGAPLPEGDALLAHCAYCSSTNVLAAARPRKPTRVKDQRNSLQDTLETQRAEQLARLIFLVIGGLPALWGAWVALRFVWLHRG